MSLWLAIIVAVAIVVGIVALVIAILNDIGKNLEVWREHD